MDAKIEKLQNLFNEFVGITKNVQVFCDSRNYNRVPRISSAQSKQSTLNCLDKSQVKTLELNFNGNRLNGSQAITLQNFNGISLDDCQAKPLEPVFYGNYLDGSQAKAKALEPVFYGNHLDGSQAKTIESFNGGRLGDCQAKPLEPLFYGNHLDGSQAVTLEIFNGISLDDSQAKFLEPVVYGNHLDGSQAKTMESFNGGGYTYTTVDNTASTVMAVSLSKDATFSESRLNQVLSKDYLNDKESYPRLTNYLYHLTDDGAGSMQTHDLYDSRSGMSEYHSDLEYGNEVARTEKIQHNYLEIEDKSSEYEILNGESIAEYNLDLGHENEAAGFDTRNEAESNESIIPSISAGSIDQSGEGDEEQDILNTDDEPDNFNFLNVKSRHGCDNTKMHVPTSDQGKYAKRLCCVYCLNRYAKLARHLESVHKNEPDVKRFRALRKGSKNRRAIIDKLRKLGQYEWNRNLKINGGELSTSRRPNQKFFRRAIFYKTCAKCLGIYSLNGLRYHWRRCTKFCLVGERIVKQLSRAVEGRVHEDAFDDLRTIIFPKMREDDEVLAIRYDWIVITFGNDLCLNYSPHYQHAMIRTKLRNAGKLILASKQLRADITDLASLYHVKYCDTVIQAIRVIAQFNLKSKTFKSPGTAAALVTLINTIGELLIIEAMKMEDEDKEKAVERFLKVFQKDAKLKINKIVTVNQLKARRERSENIPSTDDVCKLATFLDRERETCFSELTERYTYENWLYLAQLTMMSVLVFNRKRVGDTQNILVCDFDRREIITSRCDGVPLRTRDTIKSRITTRGKLYRTVPVLLKHNFDDCLNLILRYRKDVGVPESNEFVFGLPSKSGNIKVIDAGALFRKYSEICGAENPSSLRGTNLRKHFASMCATLNLTDTDVANVAKFMGHTDSVHRNVYRQNPLHEELKISRFLDFAQGKSNVGTISANDVTGPSNPDTKRNRTQKMPNAVVTKKARKQTEKPNTETQRKPTKKQVNVVNLKKPQKLIKVTNRGKSTKKMSAVNVIASVKPQKQTKATNPETKRKPTKRIAKVTVVVARNTRKQTKNC